MRRMSGSVCRMEGLLQKCSASVVQLLLERANKHTKIAAGGRGSGRLAVK